MGLRHPVVNIDAICIEYMGFRGQCSDAIAYMYVYMYICT